MANKKTVRERLQEIEMTPIDKSKTFHKVYVYVDKAKQGIYSTKVLDKNGNKYTYTVNSLNGNAVVNDQLLYLINANILAWKKWI